MSFQNGSGEFRNFTKNEIVEFCIARESQFSLGREGRGWFSVQDFNLMLNARANHAFSAVNLF